MCAGLVRAFRSSHSLFLSNIFSAMPTGHFSIADLSFSFEGTLKELAHCQEIIREIEEAEQRLRRASGTEEVVLIYDQDLESERGTFDKMRLRAYSDTVNYTLDLGVTDTNPLGIYVGYDQNIEVYDRESGETWQIDPEGHRIEDAEAQNEAPTRETPASQPSSLSEEGSSTRSTAQPDAPAGEKTTPPSRTRSRAEIGQAAEALRRRLKGVPPEQLVGETRIPDGPLGDKLKGFVEYCGRDENYLSRVLDAVEVSAVDNLSVRKVPDVIDMIADEAVLRENESFEPDDDLPF
jgi:hypothetical protein